MLRGAAERQALGARAGASQDTELPVISVAGAAALSEVLEAENTTELPSPRPGGQRWDIIGPRASFAPEAPGEGPPCLSQGLGAPGGPGLCLRLSARGFSVSVCLLFCLY